MIFTGLPGLVLARFGVSPCLVRSDLLAFENLLESERSGFEAVMHKVVHTPTMSLNM